MSKLKFVAKGRVEEISREDSAFENYDSLVSWIRSKFQFTASEGIAVTTQSHIFVSNSNIKEISRTEEVFFINANKDNLTFETVESAVPSPSLREETAKANYTFETAVCEAVDNSIQYTARNHELKKERTVHIEVDYEKKSFIEKDNGSGVGIEHLTAWVTLSEKGFVENIDKVTLSNETLILYGEELIAKHREKFTLVNYSTGLLSRYGVGIKYCLSLLASRPSDVFMKTKTTENVNSFELSWKIGSENWDYRKKITTNAPSGSYTIIDVPNLDIPRLFPNVTSQTQFNAQMNIFASFLAQNYFYFIHGHEMFTNRVLELYNTCSRIPEASPKRMKVVSNNNNMNSNQLTYSIDTNKLLKIYLNGQNLENVVCSEARYLKQAVDAFPLYFQWKMDINGTVHDVVVMGAIFYYPYVDEQETLPVSDAYFSTDNNSKENGVEYFWMLRWLSQEPRRRLPFMESFGEKEKITQVEQQQLPHYVFSRVKGSLFLGRQFTPTFNKTQVFERGGVVFKKFLQLCENEDLKKSYRTWLKQCHARYDRDIDFEDYKRSVVGNPNQELPGIANDNIERFFYEKVKEVSTCYQVGMFVRLKPDTKTTSKLPVGKIMSIYHKGGGSYKPLDKKVYIQFIPYSYYEVRSSIDGEISISCIDKVLSEKELEDYKREQEEEKPKSITIRLPGKVKPVSVNSFSQQSGEVLKLRVVVLNTKGVDISNSLAKYSNVYAVLKNSNEFETKEKIEKEKTSNKLTFQKKFTKAGEYNLQVVAKLESEEEITSPSYKIKIKPASPEKLKIDWNREKIYQLGSRVPSIVVYAYDHHNNECLLNENDLTISLVDENAEECELEFKSITVSEDGKSITIDDLFINGAIQFDSEEHFQSASVRFDYGEISETNEIKITPGTPQKFTSELLARVVHLSTMDLVLKFTDLQGNLTSSKDFSFQIKSGSLPVISDVAISNHSITIPIDIKSRLFDEERSSSAAFIKREELGESYLVVNGESIMPGEYFKATYNKRANYGMFLSVDGDNVIFKKLQTIEGEESNELAITCENSSFAVKFIDKKIRVLGWSNRSIFKSKRSDSVFFCRSCYVGDSSLLPGAPGSWNETYLDFTKASPSMKQEDETIILYILKDWSYCYQVTVITSNPNKEWIEGLCSENELDMEELTFTYLQKEIDFEKTPEESGFGYYDIIVVYSNPWSCLDQHNECLLFTLLNEGESILSEFHRITILPSKGAYSMSISSEHCEINAIDDRTIIKATPKSQIALSVTLLNEVDELAKGSSGVLKVKYNDKNHKVQVEQGKAKFNIAFKEQANLEVILKYENIKKKIEVQRKVGSPTQLICLENQIKVKCHEDWISVTLQLADEYGSYYEGDYPLKFPTLRVDDPDVKILKRGGSVSESSLGKGRYQLNDFWVEGKAGDYFLEIISEYEDPDNLNANSFNASVQIPLKILPASPSIIVAEYEDLVYNNSKFTILAYLLDEWKNRVDLSEKSQMNLVCPHLKRGNFTAFANQEGIFVFKDFIVEVDGPLPVNSNIKLSAREGRAISENFQLVITNDSSTPSELHVVPPPPIHAGLKIPPLQITVFSDDKTDLEIDPNKLRYKFSKKEKRAAKYFDKEDKLLRIPELLTKAGEHNLYLIYGDIQTYITIQVTHSNTNWQFSVQNIPDEVFQHESFTIGSITLVDEYKNIVLESGEVQVGLSQGEESKELPSIQLINGSIEDIELDSSSFTTPGLAEIRFQYESITYRHRFSIEERAKKNQSDQTKSIKKEIKKKKQQIEELKQKVDEFNKKLKGKDKSDQSQSNLQSQEKNWIQFRDIETTIAKRAASVIPDHLQKLILDKSINPENKCELKPVFMLGSFDVCHYRLSNELKSPNPSISTRVAQLIAKIIGKSAMERIIIMGNKTDEENVVKALMASNKHKNFTVQRLSLLPDCGVKELNNEQKSLNIAKPKHEEGFIGYLVNLIYLKPDQLKRNLRRTLWYSLLKNTALYKTRDDAFNAVRINSSGFIVSLDGYIYMGYEIPPSSVAPQSLILPGLDPEMRSGWKELLEEIKLVQEKQQKQKEKRGEFSAIQNELLETQEKLKATLEEVNSLNKQLEQFTDHNRV